MNVLSFIRSLTRGAVPVADDQPLPVYEAIPPAGVAGRGGEYEVVGIGQTAITLGPTGAVGDRLSHVIFQPEDLVIGECQILDGATPVVTVAGGTLLDVRPIIVPMNAYSVSGAWKVTTGSNVGATGFGDFT